MAKKNWFNSLNESLASEKLVALWPLGTNISYDQTVSVTVDNGRRKVHISVCRDNNGMYERPLHYDAGALERL